jgi:hypothetical protein
MTEEKVSERIFHFGEYADKINANDGYVIFNREGYDPQAFSLRDAAYTLGEKTIGGIASALGIIGGKRKPEEEAHYQL